MRLLLESHIYSVSSESIYVPRGLYNCLDPDPPTTIFPVLFQLRIVPIKDNIQLYQNSTGDFTDILTWICCGG